MKIKAQVELDISEEERKRIALEYLESLIPYNHVLFKIEDNHYWYECFKNHDGDIYRHQEKRAATSFEVNLYKTLQELKK